MSAAPALESTDDVPRTGIEAARRWAVSMELRSGHTWSVRPGALVPLVAQWCAERGWPPVDVGAIGRGLVAAGLVTRERPSDPKRLLLHRDDAARLRKLVWEAWRPRVPPGERPRTKPGRQPLQAALARLAYLESKPPTPSFHAYLAAHKGGLSREAAPVVDSRGRVYPSVSYAARALSAKRDKERAPDRLATALQRDGHWKGMVWRCLLPEELKLVPRDAPCGARIEALSWQYACHERGLLTTGQSRKVRNRVALSAFARDDEREG